MRVRFEPPPGLVCDDTAFAARGAWAGANHVRFNQGRPETCGGWEAIIAASLTGVCRNLLPWTDTSGALLIGFGTHSALQVYYGGGLYDITPAGLAAGLVDGTGGQGFGTGAYSTGGYSQPSTADFWPRTWSLATWGQSLMAAPKQGTIYWWQNAVGTAAAPLTNAPAKVTAMLVNTRRQVMAFGCSIVADGSFGPLTIRWSALKDPTAWTPSSINTAGEYTLEGGGRIMGARMMGDYALVWTDSALYLGTYTGSTANLWQWDRVAQHCGLIGPNAVAVVGQLASWIAPSGQFYSYGLGGQPSILPCPIRADLLNHLAGSQQEKIHLASIGRFGEVWAFYPDSRDGVECSRAVFFNAAGHWSRSILARTAFADADPALYPVGVSAAGRIYWHEKGQSADGGALAASITSADQFLGDSQQVMRITDCWPDFQSQLGAVSLTLSTRMRPADAPAASPPSAMAPGTAVVNLRKTGRLFNVTFASSATPSFWRLGAPSFNAQGEGRR